MKDEMSIVKIFKLSECFSSKKNPVIIICNVEDITSITDGFITPAKKGEKQYKLFGNEVIKGVKSDAFNINGRFFVFIDEKDSHKLNISITNENILDKVLNRKMWQYFAELATTPGSGWGFKKNSII